MQAGSLSRVPPAPRRFGLVGHGWRTDFYLRIAAALPDRFTCVGIVTRTAEAGRRVEERWGVPSFRAVADLVNGSQLDAMVVSVPPIAAAPIIADLVRLRIPVLTETPPAPTLDGLADLWKAVGDSPLVMVAEQHPYLPVFVALQRLIDQGVLGEVSSASISWTHEYHAVALLRRLAGIGGEGSSVTAIRAAVPLVDGPDRSGWPELPAVSQREHVTAVLRTGDRSALYDFTETQWFNPLRRRQVSVRGSHGEVVGSDVTWTAGGEIMSAPIVRRQLGLDGNLEGTGLDRLTWCGQTLYRNPFPGGGLSDEEIAIATCLVNITNPDQPAGYSLADACEDRYLSLLVAESADRETPLISRAQPWSAALV